MSEMHKTWPNAKWIYFSRSALFSLFDPVQGSSPTGFSVENRWKYSNKQKQMFCLELRRLKEVGTGNSELRRKSGRTGSNISVKCAVRLMVQGAGKDQEHLFRHPKLSDLSVSLDLPGPGDRIPNYFESKASVRKVSTLEYDLLDSLEYVIMLKIYAQSRAQYWTIPRLACAYICKARLPACGLRLNVQRDWYYTHFDEHGTVTMGRYQDPRASMGHLISNF